MPFPPPPRLPTAAASVLAAGLMLTVVGCSHLTPLGPDPATALPQPHHLRSPLVLQAVRVPQSAPVGGCPAGYVTLPGGGSPGMCYRKTGTAVTITSAAVSPVSPFRPPPAAGTAGSTRPVRILDHRARCRRVGADSSHHDGYRAPAPPRALPPPAPPPQLSPSALPAAPGASSASRHSSPAGSSKSLCPAGIKLSSFSAYWPRLAEGSEKHHGLSRRPDWPAPTQGDLPAQSSPRLSSAQTQTPVEGPAATGTPGTGPHARRHRSPGTYGCCGPGDHLPDHRDAQLASAFRELDPAGAHDRVCGGTPGHSRRLTGTTEKPRSARPAGSSPLPPNSRRSAGIRTQYVGLLRASVTAVLGMSPTPYDRHQREHPGASAIVA